MNKEDDYFIFHSLDNINIFKYFNLILFKIFAKINELNKDNLISIQSFEICENISTNFFRLYNLQYVFKNLEKKDNDYEKIDYEIMNTLFEINSLFNKKNEISDDLIKNFKEKINKLLSTFYDNYLIDNKLIFLNNLKININPLLIS